MKIKTISSKGFLPADGSLPMSGNLTLGGNELIGDSISGGDLQLRSTIHTTKGKILFGDNSVFDETNDRIGLGVVTPGAKITLAGHSTADGGIYFGNSISLYTMFASILFTNSYFQAGQAFVSGNFFGGLSGEDILLNSTQGKIGLGVSYVVVSGAGKVHIGGDTLRIDAARTPTSASDAGNAGEICWDTSYIYVCIATNTWTRAAISTW